jgi:hypothetical protein
MDNIEVKYWMKELIVQLNYNCENDDDDIIQINDPFETYGIASLLISFISF